MKLFVLLDVDTHNALHFDWCFSASYSYGGGIFNVFFFVFLISSGVSMPVVCLGLSCQIICLYQVASNGRKSYRIKTTQ